MRCASPAIVCLLLALQLLAAAPRALAQNSKPISSPWAATERDEDLTIKLVTFGPGEAIHEYFGHNALIVEDTRRQLAILYDFGLFDFGPDMLPKYLQGQLEFGVGKRSVENTFGYYASVNRSIRVLELDLPAANRRKLAERLAWWARPENNTYRYHHYRDNCSTKLRDLLNEATSGQLREIYSTPSQLDYRSHTWRYTEHDPFIHFLLVLWMNDSMEDPIENWHDAFLPSELERLVEATVYRDADGRERNLTRRAYTVYDSRQAAVPRDPGTRIPRVAFWGLLLGGLAVFLGWRAGRQSRFFMALFGLHQIGVGIACGVPGLVLFLFLFTGWDVTHWNENLWLTNPLTLAAIPLGLAIAFGSLAALRLMSRIWMLLAAMTVLALLLKLAPNFDQNNGLAFALLLPVNLGFALGTKLALGVRDSPQQHA